MTKILAIDDKQDNLITLSAVLNNLIPGCTVITAQSGAQGIEKARKELPDTILLDIKMPKMDGFEVCKRLKSDIKTKRIPIIMLTAVRTDAKSRIKGLDIGADAFLTKPIDEVELTAQVKVMLRIKKAEDILRKEKDLLEKLVQERTKQLVHAQKMEAIGTLAGGIAHDFNNILVCIMGYTEMSLYQLPKGTEAHEFLHHVLDATYRAKELVKQILTFSRQSQHEPKPVQISIIVKEVIKLLRASLPATIELRQNIKAPSGSILADPTQIHQVLMNLCTNAAHAMREKGGVLDVCLAEVDINRDSPELHLGMEPGPYMKLTVSDTGHGMDCEVMERIFDPYFTTKEKGEGTGLGLAVVHGIMENLGGMITVDSEPGKGTTFQVFFPRIETKLKSYIEISAPLPRGHECILFVDDEELLADIGQRILEHLGYNVVAKTSSIEVLEIFRSQPDKFDLVITDQTMPKMTGVDLAKELLRIRPDIPIILCTGFSETVTAKQAKAMGIREFVMKPVVMREMAETIRCAIDESL